MHNKIICQDVKSIFLELDQNVDYDHDTKQYTKPHFQIDCCASLEEYNSSQDRDNVIYVISCIPDCNIIKILTYIVMFLNCIILYYCAIM